MNMMKVLYDNVMKVHYDVLESRYHHEGDMSPAWMVMHYLAKRFAPTILSVCLGYMITLPGMMITSCQNKMSMPFQENLIFRGLNSGRATTTRIYLIFSYLSNLTSEMGIECFVTGIFHCSEMALNMLNDTAEFGSTFLNMVSYLQLNIG